MSTNKINNIEKVITPKQCKAARAFLGWSQADLADKVRVVQKTIADFEREARTPQRRTIEDIKMIFEKAGIRFKNEDGSFGVELVHS
jgi:ribosome-binding protein aMBF1 (putative translation factor)